jgi:cytosine/adenosine deaminase-related metal-dependent hydrolase
MEKAVPLALNVFKMGLKTKGLKMVFGTDAVESLGLGDRTGSIAPGLDADLIAVDGWRTGNPACPDPACLGQARSPVPQTIMMAIFR